MTGETENAATEVEANDNAETITDENADNLTYFDPDEDGAPEDTAEVEANDDDAKEEGEPEAEAEDAEADGAPVVYAEDTAVVKMADGTEIPVAELKGGYFRQDDYSKKTQALANERKQVEANVERMQRIAEAFVDHVSKLVPEAPEASLALTDPAKYTAMKAQHDAAMAQVNQLIEAASAPREVADTLSQADRQRLLQAENEKLIAAFPETGNTEGRQKFFGEVKSVANELGFTDQELGSIADHRVFALAHWAAKGLAADRASAKAKAKVEKAPPATPRKPGQGARGANRNAEAMRKLARSGSLRDALEVDFE